MWQAGQLEVARARGAARRLNHSLECWKQHVRSRDTLGSAVAMHLQSTWCRYGEVRLSGPRGAWWQGCGKVGVGHAS